MNIKLNDNAELEYIIKMCRDEGVHIKATKWTSRYNKSVTYDFKPPMPEFFDVEVTLDGDRNKLNFVKYLYTKHSDTLTHLNNCYSLKGEDS